MKKKKRGKKDTACLIYWINPQINEKDPMTSITNQGESVIKCGEGS
jgi:hypothetical protein